MRRRSSSTFAELAAAVLLSAAFPAIAQAQACCAGAGTLTSARLTEEERWGVGLTLRAARQIGLHDREGRWSAQNEGLREESYEQQLFGVIRLPWAIQLSALLPVVETRRAVPGLSDVGGGLGDLRTGLRWDLHPPGASAVLPGVALTGGMSWPTGRAAEEAMQPLAADATGLGTATAQAGLAVEQTDGIWLWQLSGQYIHTFDRTVSGWRFEPGPQWQAGGAVGRGFSSGAGLALSASMRHDTESALNGAALPGSSRTMPALGLAIGTPLARGWRLQASAQATPPLEGAGRSANGYLTFTASVLHIGY